MSSTYTEYLSAKFPPEIRPRWRLLEILEDHKVARIAGWDHETTGYLRNALNTLCQGEPEVG